MNGHRGSNPKQRLQPENQAEVENWALGEIQRQQAQAERNTNQKSHAARNLPAILAEQEAQPPATATPQTIKVKRPPVRRALTHAMRNVADRRIGAVSRVASQLSNRIQPFNTDVRMLKERLRSVDERVAADAARRLAEIAITYGSEEALLPLLEKAATATPVFVGFRGNTNEEIYRDMSEPIRRVATEALRRIDARCAQVLLDFVGGKLAWMTGLGGPFDQVLAAVEKAMVRFGADALPVVVPALQRQQTAVSAARVLVKLDDMEAARALVDALCSRDDFVVTAVTRSLIGARNTSLLDALVRALQQGSVRMRQAAADALGWMADRRSVEVLVAALGDEDWKVCANAVIALGRLNDRRAVTPLVALIAGSNAAMRLVAAGILGRLGDRRATAPLVGLLDDADIVVRAAGAEALGALGDPRAANPLARALEREWEDRARMAMMVALVQLRDSRALEPLLQVLERKRGTLEQRPKSAELLGELGDPRAIWPLATVLVDSEPQVRRAAAVSLEQLDLAQAPLVPEERKRRKLGRYLRAARHNEDGDRQVTMIAKILLNQLTTTQGPNANRRDDDDDDEDEDLD
ncbi:MAG TPA: HEAT repeat domain-containing protein [Ktedonobacterales bacterium]|jgi:HEAT repeat protein